MLFFSNFFKKIAKLEIGKKKLFQTRIIMKEKRENDSK